MKNFLIGVALSVMFLSTPANAYDLPKQCYAAEFVIAQERVGANVIIRVSKEDAAKMIPAVLKRFDFDDFTADTAIAFVRDEVTSIVWFIKDCAAYETVISTDAWKEIFTEVRGGLKTDASFTQPMDVAVTCENDYSKLKDAMLRAYDGVYYINQAGLDRLNVMFKSGTFGEVDHMIIATDKTNRTFDITLWKCSKMIKSWVGVTVADFDDAQKTWQILYTEMPEWGKPL